jgi:hypothetical protein
MASTHTEQSGDAVAEDAGGESVRLTLRTAATWFSGRPAYVQVLFWFVMILLLKHGNLFEPPVWDSAMGIFPAAIYLYDTGYDIRGLLQQTSWLEGGPNVHSLSLLTWTVAVVMTVTDSPQVTFLIIHLLTFAAFAWALQGFTVVLRSYGLAPRTVLAAAAFLLLIPMVLVQVGSLYTETLVLCTSVGAWVCWRKGKLGTAVLWCVIGIFVKLTAVPIAALVGAALLFSGRPYNVRKILLILTLPLALWVSLSLPGWLGATPQAVHDWGQPEQLMRKFQIRMQVVPDVRWLIRLALLSGIAYFVARVWKDQNLRVITGTDPDSRSRLICLAMPFVFMAGVLAMIHAGALFLSRYLLPVLPFAIGSVLLFTSQLRGTRVRGQLVAFVVLIGACLYSAANYNGRFYGAEKNSFSVVERSHAYRDFHALQVEAIGALAEKPDEVPAFVSREIDYMISHRMMGYVEERIPNTFPIYVEPHQGRELGEFPDEFILLRSNRWHGGAKIRSLLRQATASEEHEVTEGLIERNGFKARLYRVKRTRSGERG